MYYLAVTSASGTSEYSVSVSSDVVETYLGAASIGDLVSYIMNLTTNTYSIYNLTTGSVSNGTFTLSPDGRQGMADGTYPLCPLARRNGGSQHPGPRLR